MIRPARLSRSWQAQSGMADPSRVENDSFQDVLLILRQVTLRTEGL
jgi:hypothetical protein